MRARLRPRRQLRPRTAPTRAEVAIQRRHQERVLPESRARVLLPPTPPPRPEQFVSNIDPTVPVYGNPTTQSVRDNFSAAKSEIEALQAGKLDLAGGVMTGKLTLAADPVGALDAATMQFVQAAAGAAFPEAPNDGNAYLRAIKGWSSGGTLTQALHLHNGLGIEYDSNNFVKFHWDGAGLHAIIDGSADQGSLATWGWVENSFLNLAGGTLSGPLALNNGLNFGSVVDSGPDSGANHINLYGTSYGIGLTSARVNYFAAAGAGHYFRIGGADTFAITNGGITSAAAITLPANPTTNLQAATKQYVDTKAGAGLGDAPSNATWAYGRKQAAWTIVPQVVQIGGGAWDPGTIDTGNIGLTGLWEVSNQTGATGWPAGNVDQCAMILHGWNSNAGWQNQLMMGGRERNGGAAIWYRSMDSGSWLPWRRLLSDAGLFTVAGATTFNGSPTFNAPVIANSGLSFGSVTDSGPDSGALHIQLYSGNYGFGVTNNRLNYFTASGGGHYFRIAGSDIMSVTQGLVTIGSALSIPSNTQAVPTAGSVGTFVTSNLTGGGGESVLWTAGIGSNPGFDFRRVVSSGSTSFRMAFLASDGTFTPAGPVVLPADPATAMQAATKQYVDAHSGSGGGIPDAPNNANAYMRSGGAWTSGGTLTSPLTLTGGSGTTSALIATGGSALFRLTPNATGGAYNGLITAGDTLLLASNGAVDTGGLTIGLWSTTNTAIRLSPGLVTIGSPVTASGYITATAGLNFGNNVDASPDDFHLHLSMFGNQYGIGITGARMNYVVPGTANHYFRSGGSDIVNIGAGGTTFLAPVAFAATPATFGVNGGGGMDVIVNGAAGTWRNFRQQTNGIDRWTWGCTADAESGGNAGSNLILNCWSDSGANLAAPLYFIRATGLATVAGNPTAALGIATKQYVDAAAPASVKQVPVPFTFAGKPAASALVNVAVAMAMTISASLAGSTSFRTTAPAANATFTLNKISGGTTTALGTVTIVPGSQTPTLAGSGGSLAVGDVLQIVAPTTQDTALADVGITILAARS